MTLPVDLVARVAEENGPWRDTCSLLAEILLSTAAFFLLLYPDRRALPRVHSPSISRRRRLRLSRVDQQRSRKRHVPARLQSAEAAGAISAEPYISHVPLLGFPIRWSA